MRTSTQTYENLQTFVMKQVEKLGRSGRGAPYNRTIGSEQPSVDLSPKRPSRPEQDDVIAAESIFKAGGWMQRYAPTDLWSPPSSYQIYETSSLGIRSEKALFIPLNTVKTRRSKRVVPNSASGIDLLLVPITPNALVGCGTPNRAGLLANATAQARGAFRPWAELHPSDAERLHVKDPEDIRIISEYGRATLPLRIWTGVRPGTVAVAWAPNARGAGRYARFWEPRPERLASGIRAGDGSRVVTGLAVYVNVAGEKKQ